MRGVPSEQAGLLQQLAQRLRDRGLPALGELAASGRATSTKSWPAGTSPAADQNASRSSRFIRLRSTAPPTLRPTEIARVAGRRASPARGKEWSTRYRLACERPSR